MGASESPIMFAVRAALVRSGHWHGWRNNSGKLTPSGSRVPISFGLGVGSPDLIGFLTTGPHRGRFTAFEVKSGVGRVSREQKAWIESARNDGAAVFVVRSEAEALDALTRALRGGVE